MRLIFLTGSESALEEAITRATQKLSGGMTCRGEEVIKSQSRYDWSRYRRVYLKVTSDNFFTDSVDMTLEILT